MPGIFPLERRSELRVRADKDNVSHQLRTTNKKAELMRRVPETQSQRFKEIIKNQDKYRKNKIL